MSPKAKTTGKKSTLSQESPLVKTKLYIPSLQPHIISRPRLVRKLTDGLKCQLTLISAPPGFGKTSLLSEWIDKGSYPVGWYSIDSGDNNPVLFLRYIISALQSVSSDIGRAALSQLNAPQTPPFESILTSLVNDIASYTKEFVLILDDYHLIDIQPIHKMFSFFLDHAPKNMHVFISTRSDPPFRLSRLRSCQQLVEIRATDLSFTMDETSSLLNDSLKLGLSDEEILSVDSKVEGWIAGLQLLALSLQGRTDIPGFIKDFHANNRYIADYLMEEVLNRQSKKTQDFLLHTSILDRLSGPLCDSVTGQSGGQQMLVRLDKANLFIFPLDKERTWFRYHRLFSDLLQQRLLTTQKERCAQLHNRASVWFEEKGFKEDSIKHALAGKNFKRAAELIERIAENSWDRGQQTKFMFWMNRLPKDFWTTKPQLYIYFARALIYHGQLDAAEKSLQEGQTAIQKKGDSVKQKELKGRLAAISAILAAFRGDIQGNIQHSRRAVESLNKKDLMWRSVAATTLGMAYGWSGIGDMMAARHAFSYARTVSKEAGNTYYETFAELCLASVDGLQGRFEKALATFQKLIEEAESLNLGRTSQTGTIYGSLANIVIERGYFEEGMQLLRKGLDITEAGRDVVALSSNRLVMAYALFFKREYTEVEKILKRIEKDKTNIGIPMWMRHVVTTLRARIWQESGNKGAVVRWIKERELSPEDNITYRREVEYSVLVRHLIAQKRYEEAENLLSRLIQNSVNDTRIVSSIQWRLLKVVNAHTQGEMESAEEELRKALYLAEPGGIVRSIIAEGRAVSELIEKIYEEEKSGREKAKISIPLPYLKKLRLAFKETEPIKKKTEDKLSERELEVLHLIADGYTYQEIAQRLFISLNTVRTHTKNIHSKLGVHNRTMAIKRAKELGWL